MGLRINTNTQSIAAQRSISNTKMKQDGAMEKLSSGTRIVRAGDDAAGLAISEKLKGEIRGQRQAERNASDGISMIQVAEGGLNEVSNMLIRLRELSVQAASDTIGPKEREFTDKEFQNLVSEVDRIANSTRFNGSDLLNGKGNDFDFQVGTHNIASQDRLTFKSGDSDATIESLGISGLSVTSKASAQDNLDVIDVAMDKVNGNRATLGAMQNRLTSTVTNLQVATENLSAANSRIRDTDVAIESANLAKENVLAQAGISVLAQSNQTAASALRLLS